MGKKDKKDRRDRKDDRKLGFDDLRAMEGLPQIEEKPKKQDYSQFEGKDHTRNTSKNRGSQPSNRNAGGSQRGGAPNNRNSSVTVGEMNATAPYNFVRFPDAVLVSPLEELSNEMNGNHVAAYKKYIDGLEKLTGSIELDIDLKTPIFIRNEEGKTIAPIDPSRPILPGSSIRGMVKNLYKIITCGALRADEDYTERHLYYRCIMAVNSIPWTKPLHAAYTARMMGTSRGALVKNAKPGFLLKIGREYFIAPSMVLNPKRIFIKEYLSQYRTNISPLKSSRIDWQGTKAYIITGSQKNFKLKTRDEYERMRPNEKLRAGKQQIRYVDLQDMDKSRDHWLKIPESVIYEYENDTKRGGVNLLKYEPKTEAGKNIKQGPLTGDRLKSMVPDLVKQGVEYLIPCFFLNDGEYVTAFGHGQCFRIPYNNSIGDRIPAALRTNIVDYSDAIFGRKELWGSRVFFDDATACSPVTRLSAKKVVLGEPNPTSYQLYLQQKLNTPLVHWDMDDAKLRGYKMYWHSKGDWNKVKKADPEQDNVATVVEPIKEGAKFKGRIRFRNLSAAELGALLMIFDMNGNSNKIAYKLGQGKSLGLGSVGIKATLMLDKADDYECLFGKDGWLNSSEKVDFSEYLTDFKKEIAKAKLNSSWQGVMQDLVNMLDYSNVNGKSDWEKRIAPMESKKVKDTLEVHPYFKERIPMKDIGGVVK